jgi:hypothetical protein
VCGHISNPELFIRIADEELWRRECQGQSEAEPGGSLVETGSQDC